MKKLFVLIMVLGLGMGTSAIADKMLASGMDPSHGDGGGSISKVHDGLSELESSVDSLLKSGDVSRADSLVIEQAISDIKEALSNSESSK